MAVTYTSCWAVTTIERHSGTLEVKSAFLIDPTINDPDARHPPQSPGDGHQAATGEIHELQPMNPEPFLPTEITKPLSDGPPRGRSRPTDIVEDESPAPGLFEPGKENP